MIAHIKTMNKSRLCRRDVPLPRLHQRPSRWRRLVFRYADCASFSYTYLSELVCAWHNLFDMGSEEMTEEEAQAEFERLKALPLEQISDGSLVDSDLRLSACAQRFVSEYQNAQGLPEDEAPAKLTEVARSLCHFLQTMPEIPQAVSHLLLIVGATVEAGADAIEVAIVFLPVLDLWATRAKAAIDSGNEALEESYGGVFDHLGMSSAAVLSRSKQGRQDAKNLASLYDTSVALRWHARFLHGIVTTLDDEEIVVIHPELRFGLVVRISGISNNWQLHMLLSHHIREAVQGTWPEVTPLMLSMLNG